MSNGRGQSHEELSSLLTEQNLPLPLAVCDTTDSTVFKFDSERTAEEVFPQSVASGSPTPTGVILWTRIESTAYDPERPLAVEVATDEKFTEHVHRGVVEHPDHLTNRDYTVKIDLNGTLDPDREYWYRFMSQSALAFSSIVGRHCAKCLVSLPAVRSQMIRRQSIRSIDSSGESCVV